jgi:hypothetical protein
VHYTIGGDPGGDLFTSPGDPAFWAHHSQMDRMWTIWYVVLFYFTLDDIPAAF